MDLKIFSLLGNISTLLGKFPRLSMTGIQASGQLKRDPVRGATRRTGQALSSFGSGLELLQFLLM